MTEPSAIKVTNALVKIYPGGPIWSTRCYGNTIVGNDATRPIMIRNREAFYSGIDYPVYGFGMGYNFGAYTAQLQVAADSVTPGGLMTGKVRVRECLYREATNERSWAGAESAELDLGNTPSHVVAQSNSWAYLDSGITHRIFYVCFVEQSGVYYEAARCPYTTATGNNTDEVTINISSSEIIKKRPLEDQ